MVNRKVKELQMDDIVFRPSLNSKKFEKSKSKTKSDSISIIQAKDIVFRQMTLEGLRQKTLLTYNQAFTKYVEFLKLEIVDDIDKVGFT